MGPGDIVEFGLAIAVALGAPALVFVVIRAAMRMFDRRTSSHGVSSDEVNALRVELDELRELPPRITELEERLDFAERMLAQQREAERLPGGSDAAR